MCCRRIRVHVQVALREHCDIDRLLIAFEVLDVVVVGVRTGADVTFQESASSTIIRTTDGSMCDSTGCLKGMMKTGQQQGDKRPCHACTHLC